MASYGRYGRKLITKTDKGYEVDGTTYPTLNDATDAINKQK